MRRLVFGLLSKQHEHAKLRELTIAWSRYGYHGQIIEGNSINDILNQACLAGYEYCFIQKAGHIIDERWHHPNWNIEGFHAALQRRVNDQSFFITGHWQVSNTGCVGLDTNSLLVNLTLYQAWGKPLFGNISATTQNLLRVDPASIDTDHLTADISEAPFSLDVEGWNFIDISLRHNTPILGFPSVIKQRHLNVSHDSTEHNSFEHYLGKNINGLANDPSINQDQHTFLNNVSTQTERARRGVFLWNIESYQDLTSPTHPEPLETVCCVAAGFKPNHILQTNGFTEQTEVLFFDYSNAALTTRQQMVEQWDGDDFPHFVRYLFKTNPHPETFYQLWHETTPDNVNWEDIEWFWQHELSHWDSPAQFKQHWQNYRQLPHQYIACNLLTEPQQLLKKLEAKKHTYVWWSNAFFTVNSNWFYSSAQRKQLYQRWIESIAKQAPHARLNGADYNNVAVNGITAEHYLSNYNRQPCDELNPRARHDIGIHF